MRPTLSSSPSAFLMRLTFLVVAAAWWLSGPVVAVAIPDPPQMDAGFKRPRVVNMDIQKGSKTGPLDRHRLRRRGSIETPLDNLDTLYFVNATMGTPPQSLRLHLDTGSSDLWVNTPSSSLCSSTQDLCEVSGTYVANSSSTYQYVGSYFNISYIDGSGATGDYVTDTFTIGDQELTDFQFGIGYSSSASQGILGIGYPVNEVQVARTKLKPYDNLAAKMKAEGLIDSAAFSLYLNDLDASTGSILFGGVDTNQFQGQLQTLPIEAEGGEFAEFLITLTAVTLGSNALGSNMALAVLLDSGSSLSYLPDRIASRLFSSVDAIYDEEEGVAFVPCDLARQSQTLDFTFTSPTISVAMDELVLSLMDENGGQMAFANGEPACLFGIAPAGEGTVVLGDTFLRSAYLVYDMDNNEISLAQTAFNATESNVLEITAGKGGVPSAAAVQNPVAATDGLQISTTDQEDAGVSIAVPRLRSLAVVVFAVAVGVMTV